jgi:hypothetical protein
MKYKIHLSLVFLLVLLACQKSTMQSVEKSTEPREIKQEKPSQETETENSLYLKENLLLPSATQECLEKAKEKVGEPIRYDLSMNPYFLRFDFNGDKVIDYAIIVAGKTTNKYGLVICKDAKEAFVFGELARSKTPLTNMPDDNFVGSFWDIMTNKEVQEQFSKHHDKDVKELALAKGEVIIFGYAKDGILYIYWDGKNFRSVGEG